MRDVKPTGKGSLRRCLGIKPLDLRYLEWPSATADPSLLLTTTMSLLISLLTLGVGVPSVLASLSLPAGYPGATYSPQGLEYWTPYCPGPPQPCFDGCAAYFGSNTDVFTFDFPSPSTTFEWWGYLTNDAGMAKVCFDFVTSGSGCHTVSYYSATANPNTDPPQLIFSITGLPNAIHFVKATNIADTDHGNAYGEISVDHFVIDGSPVTVPTFPRNTFLTNIPTPSDLDHTYQVHLTLGGNSPPLNSQSNPA